MFKISDPLVDPIIKIDWSVPKLQKKVSAHKPTGQNCPLTKPTGFRSMNIFNSNYDTKQLNHL